MRLIVMRHGLAANNTPGAIKWMPDAELVPDGREQARQAGDELVKWLRGSSLTIYASPLPRTRETAEIVAYRLGIGGLETAVRLVHELTDIDLSRPLEQTQPLMPVEWGQNARYRWCDGESVADVFARIKPWVEKTFRMHAQSALIVTHAVLFAPLICALTGDNLDDSWQDKRYAHDNGEFAVLERLDASAGFAVRGIRLGSKPQPGYDPAT